MQLTHLGFNILTLRVIMLWPSDGKLTLRYNLKSWCLLIVVYLSASTCLNGIIRTAFIESDGYDPLIQRIIAIIDFAGCVYMRYCFLSKLENVHKLIEEIKEFELFCPRSEIQATEAKVQKYSKAIVIYWFFGNVMNSIAPLSDRTHCSQLRKSKLYEERDPCGLMARAFYPFDISKNLFPLAYCIQVYTCVVITYYVVVLTLLLVGVMMHCLTQLNYCRKLINDLRSEIGEKKTDLESKVRRIIIYHIKIIGFSEKTNEAFSNMMMLHLTLTSLVISALGFVILIVNNFNDSIRFTLHLFGWLVLLLLICYYGQVLIDESTALAEDIYYVPWHEAPLNVQKNIKMILLRSQKPLTLNAANMGVMSFPTFLRVISSAYSYFTLLLNIKS